MNDNHLLVLSSVILRFYWPQFKGIEFNSVGTTVFKKKIQVLKYLLIF